MRDQFIHASFLGQSNHQVRLCPGKIRGDAEGDLELIDRFVQAAVVKQEMPEAIVRGKISRGHGEGLSPKRLTVAPMGSLDVCSPRQCDDRHATRRYKNSTLDPGS